MHHLILPQIDYILTTLRLCPKGGGRKGIWTHSVIYSFSFRHNTVHLEACGASASSRHDGGLVQVWKKTDLRLLAYVAELGELLGTGNDRRNTSGTEISIHSDPGIRKYKGIRLLNTGKTQGGSERALTGIPLPGPPLYWYGVILHPTISTTVQ